MITFEHNNKKYQEIDFDNQFTAEQEDVYSEIKAKINKIFVTTIQNGTALSDNSNALKVLETFNNSFSDLDSKTISKALAHTYVESEEEVFDVDKYNERVDMFYKMPLKKRRPLQKAIPKFLGDIMTYTMGDIQDYLPNLRQRTPQ